MIVRRDRLRVPQTGTPLGPFRRSACLDSISVTRAWRWKLHRADDPGKALVELRYFVIRCRPRLDACHRTVALDHDIEMGHVVQRNAGISPFKWPPASFVGLLCETRLPEAKE